MLLGFSLGLGLGFAFGLVFVWLGRRELIRKDEQMQMLAQEKTLVFDFVHDMVEAIGEGISREDLFQRVVHAAILSTGALSACVFERNGNLLRGVAVEGLFPPHRPMPASVREKITTRAKFVEEVLKTEVFKVGEGLVGRAARTGKGILIENALEDPQVIKHEDPALEVRSVIVVPIRFRERNLGVLAIVNPSDGGSFGRSDFSLAESLAEQAGLAIHNLDLMATQIEKNKLDVDLGLAQEVQSMLLPKAFPHVAGLQIGSVYQSAQKVGGDLYDVFSLGPNRVGLAIADVSGKGVPASLLMAICQSNLRHFARHFESPVDVLRELNEVMLGEMRQEMFVTLTYVILDFNKEEIVFARGGHELPIMVHAGEGEVTADFISSAGMALGMVPDDMFSKAVEERRIPYHVGDLLVLYTDGVTEVVNNDEIEFGNRRLAEVVTSLHRRSAEDICKGILDRVTLFSGSGPQVDDFTVLVAKHL